MHCTGDVPHTVKKDGSGITVKEHTVSLALYYRYYCGTTFTITYVIFSKSWLKMTLRRRRSILITTMLYKRITFKPTNMYE